MSIKANENIEIGNTGVNLGDLATKTPKLIYSKMVDSDSVASWNITDITIKENGVYKIIFDGGVNNNGSGSNDITNLVFQYNNITNPEIARTLIFGNDKGEMVNIHSTLPYSRIARGVPGIRWRSEISLTYRAGLIATIGNASCIGTMLQNSVSVTMSSLLGRFTGDITSIKVTTNDGEPIYISEGSFLKIYELP